MSMLSVSMCRQVQLPFCNHVFIKKKGKSCCSALILKCVFFVHHQHISECGMTNSGLRRFHLLLFCVFPFHTHETANMSLQKAWNNMSCLHTGCFSLRALCRVAASDILPDITGCQSGSSAIVVISLTKRQGRGSEMPRSCFRCHGPKDRAALTLEVSCLCNGLLMDNKMYLRLQLTRLFKNPCTLP